MNIESSPRFIEAVVNRGTLIAKKTEVERLAGYPRACRWPQEVWASYGSSLGSYVDNFTDLFDPPTRIGVYNEIKNLAKARPHAAVLDIGADTTVVEELIENHGFEFGAAISLGFRKPYTKANSRAEQINGDLLPTAEQDSSFLKADKWLAQRNLPGFRLMLSCMTYGTHPEFITDDLTVHAWLLDQAWQRLDPAGSTALLQISPIYNPELKRHKDVRSLKKAIKKLNEAGIVCRQGSDEDAYGTLRLDRFSHNPASLLGVLAPHSGTG